VRFYCILKKEFYKREGKSNVKEGCKKDGKEGREAKNVEKRLERGISQGVRLMYFTIFTVIFHILQIWMWT
jgi:hypothetical protein